MIDNFVEHIANLFSEKNHGVLVGVTRMALEVVEREPKHIPFFRRVEQRFRQDKEKNRKQQPSKHRRPHNATTNSTFPTCCAFSRIS